MNSFRCLPVIYRVLFIALNLFIAPLGATGQRVCINQTLQRIVSQFSEFPEEINTNNEIIFPHIHKTRPVVIDCNEEGVITHIGFKIFNRKITEKHPSPLYNFIERYILELYLLSGNSEIATRLKMDRVKIRSEKYSFSASKKEILQQVLSENTTDCSFYIISNNNNYTVSLISNDAELIKISVPMRYELISGFSKIEAESLFYPSLIAHISQSDTLQQSLSELEMINYKDSLYQTFEDVYLVDNMLSTSYYYKLGNQYLPVLSPEYPIESCYNLFNAPNHTQEIKVVVSQSMYGNKKMEYEVSLSQLTDFLRNQNCTIYTGVKEVNGSTINATVMAVNAELGYQHLFIFTADNRLFTHPCEHVILAKMYSYTPIHNISSIFGN